MMYVSKLNKILTVNTSNIKRVYYLEKINSKYNSKKESFVNVDFALGFGVSSFLILTMLILYSK